MLRMRFNKGVLAAFLTMPLVAQANCGPLLEAIDKAWKQERIAQYDIDSPDQPLSGLPQVVRVGKWIWSKGASDQLQRFPHAERNVMVEALRSDVAKGTAKCEALPDGTYRGQAVRRYRLAGNVGSDLTGRTVYSISRASGLPLYHEMEKLGPGGFAWVYGDAVKEPAVK